jgi:hypothetical protein
VLHWLQERFEVDSTTVPASAAAGPAIAPLRAIASAVSTDELLTVGTLDDLFDPRQAMPPPPAAPQTISGMLTEFVAEFQNIAREWDGAGAGSAEHHRPVRRLSAVS